MGCYSFVSETSGCIVHYDGIRLVISALGTTSLELIEGWDKRTFHALLFDIDNSLHNYYTKALQQSCLVLSIMMY